MIPRTKGCTTFLTLGGKKEIITLLNDKDEKPNDSLLPTCLREWVA